jgi:hypothetical protein
MSKLYTGIFKSDLPPNAKLVVAAIACSGGSETTSRVSIGDLVALSGLSRSTVIRTLGLLVDGGYVVKQSAQGYNPETGNDINTYTITLSVYRTNCQNVVSRRHRGGILGG